MKVLTTEAELRIALADARGRGCTVEFVPTMGAFHEGHLELMRRARRKPGGFVAVSLFVNPTQFGPYEDFASYPRDLDADSEAARRQGADLLFAPPASLMYPGGSISTTVDVGRLGRILEGEHRPEHFVGVATVCSKLFNLVIPDRVYLGQKDAQQVAVLRRLVADLNFGCGLVVCPTVREHDGLAMSSRNVHLDPAQRKAAAVLSRALATIAQQAARGETAVEDLVEPARQVIAGQPEVSLQYLEIVDPDSFARLERVAEAGLAVAAALVGPVRLIDNVFVGTAEAARTGGWL